MATEGKTRYAVLGLLTWQPMSGYDIKKMVELALAHFWRESYGQIYPTLNRLVADGLATKTAARLNGRRDRHVFTITPAGRRAFRAWLRQDVDEPVVRNELLLKFFLGWRRPIDERIRALESYRAQQRERYDDYVASEHVLRRALRQRTLPDELAGVLGPHGANQPREQAIAFLLTLKHGLRATEARLDWCDDALRVLRQEKKTESTP